MSTSIYIILFFAMLLFIRGMIIIFHELGHAFTGMLVYKGNVSVFIGSYGDSESGWRFTIGRLKMYLTGNPFAWEKGLCIAEQQTHSYKRDFLFTLGGPLGSLFLSLLFLSMLLTPVNEVLKVYAFLAFCYAFTDFARNLRPQPIPIPLHTGGTTFNDGYQLKIILREKGNFKITNLVYDLYKEAKYKDVILHYESLDKVAYSPMLLRLVAYSYLIEKKYQLSLNAYAEVSTLSPFTADDYCNFALSHTHLERIEEAMVFYNEALKLNENHVYALNNRGYSYNLMGEYQKGLEDFNKTILLNSEFSYAYNNRGLAKIKLGFSEEGLIDIEKSLELDAKNGYTYRNKGIYFLDKKNYGEALALFIRAKELEPDTHLIDKYLEETKALISTTI